MKPAPARSLLFLLALQVTSFACAGDGIRLLSRKLLEGLKEKSPLTLAVLTFPYSRDRMSTGSHLVSERLVTYMVQEDAVVIERRLLQKVLEERKLWQTGIVDPSSLKNMGDILGVDAIVTGTLSDVSDVATEVLARVIKVDTGEILSAATAMIQKIWMDTPRLPRVAQPRSAIPVALPPLEPMLDQSGSGKKSPQSGKRQRYYPAPVPFMVPSAAQPVSGGRK